MLINTLPQTKPRTRRRETKDMVAMVRTRTKTKIRIKEVANGRMETTLTWWPTQTPGSDARITILKGTKDADQLQRRFCRVHALNTQKMVGVVIPWDSVWICSVAGSQDEETGTTTMDTEETTVMEDPVTTAEEPAIIPTYLKEEATSRAGSNRTRSSSMMAMGNIMSQLGHKTRVMAVIMSLQQARPNVPRN